VIVYGSQLVFLFDVLLNVNLKSALEWLYVLTVGDNSLNPLAL
jgi:hypothetical protein